jgi:hypothetical protein
MLALPHPPRRMGWCRLRLRNQSKPARMKSGRAALTDAGVDGGARADRNFLGGGGSFVETMDFVEAMRISLKRCGLC